MEYQSLAYGPVVVLLVCGVATIVCTNIACERAGRWWRRRRVVRAARARGSVLERPRVSGRRGPRARVAGLVCRLRGHAWGRWRGGWHLYSRERSCTRCALVQTRSARDDRAADELRRGGVW